MRYKTSTSNLIINETTMQTHDTFMLNHKSITEYITDILEFLELFGFSKELSETKDTDLYTCYYKMYKIQITVFYKSNTLFRQKEKYLITMYVDINNDKKKFKCIYNTFNCLPDIGINNLKKELKVLLKPEYRKYKIKKLLK
jgi:hypothetical protein